MALSLKLENYSRNLSHFSNPLAHPHRYDTSGLMPPNQLLQTLLRLTKPEMTNATLHHKGSKRGFTLIELLIVVAIIGILAAVGATVIPGLLEKTKRTTAF